MAWLPDPVALFWRNRETAFIYLRIVFIAYGIVHAILPGESFYVQYMRDDVGLRADQVNNEVLPWFSYTHLTVLTVYGILTEWIVPYKIIILFSILAGQVGSRLLLIWGEGLVEMQLSEAAFAIGQAGQAIFHSYYYTLVPKEHFHSINSMSRSSYYLGRLVSSVLGQLLLDYKKSPLRDLFYISLWTTSLSALIAILFFPNGARPTILNRKEADVEALDDNVDPASTRRKSRLSRIRKYLPSDPITSQPRATLSPLIIYILASTIYIFCSAYAQSLWRELDSSVRLNGWITGASQAIIMLVTLATGYLRKRFDYHVLITPFVVVCCICVMIQASAVKTSIYFAYTGYIGTMACAYAIISLSAGETALRAKPCSRNGQPPFASLFTCVSFIVSIIQFCTHLLLSKLFKLDAIKRFYVFAAFAVLMVIATLVIVVFEEQRARRTAALEGAKTEKEEANATDMEMAAFTAAIQPASPSSDSGKKEYHLHLSPRRRSEVNATQFASGEDVGTDDLQASPGC